jgi:hypothetical protein
VPVDDEGREIEVQPGLTCREPPRPHPAAGEVSTAREVTATSPPPALKKRARELPGDTPHAQRKG